MQLAASFDLGRQASRSLSRSRSRSRRGIINLWRGFWRCATWPTAKQRVERAACKVGFAKALISETLEKQTRSRERAARLADTQSGESHLHSHTSGGRRQVRLCLVLSCSVRLASLPEQAWRFSGRPLIAHCLGFARVCRKAARAQWRVDGRIC